MSTKSNKTVLSHIPLAGVDFKQMTSRQREVFYMIAEGMSDWDIAGKLGISKRTASQHKENLVRKLGMFTSIEFQ